MSIVRRSRSRALLLVLAGVVALSAWAGLAFARSKPAPIGTGVVVIDTNLAYEGAAAAGTGMVLTSSGEVLTNNHVISGATTIKVVVPGTSHTYTARVVGYARTADVAVLQLQGATNLATVTVGSSAKLTVGQAVTALGNAGGTGTLTSAPGTITGLGRSITARDDQGSPERLTGLIETNAGVEPGDSGGPLLDNAGRVVGMDTAAATGFEFTSSGANDAYAIPIARAVAVAAQIEGGKSSATVHVGATAFLGIQVAPVDAARYGYGSYGNLPTSGGLIVGVVQGGPAATAGLVAGDVITAIDGRTMASPASITSFVLTKTPGTTVTVRYTDQTGTTATARVKLGSGPPQ